MYFGLSPDINIDDPTTYSFTKSADVLARSNTPQPPISLNLSHEEIQLFTNPTVYMKQTFLFHATDGPVTITASPADYIQVKCMINVEAHVEE